MKIIEVLKLNRGFLEICVATGIRPDDVRFIELYNEYKIMTDNGDKVSYAVALLSERYGISERKVYGLIKHMQSDCMIGSV